MDKATASDVEIDAKPSSVLFQSNESTPLTTITWLQRKFVINDGNCEIGVVPIVRCPKSSVDQNAVVLSDNTAVP